jgi:glutamine transport system permease protein
MLDMLSRWVIYFTERGLDEGLIVALQILVASTILTILWGLVIAILRMSPIKLLRIIATAYIEFFRGTPLLVQLLALFAAVPMLTGVFVSPFATAVIALTLNTGSYMAESYRSGLQAVPLGQQEAAAALGMSRVIVFGRVVFPQAIRVILPAIGNIVVGLLMTTPFVYLVGIEDMMARANQILSFTGDISVYLFVTLIYVFLGLLLLWVNTWLEKRIRLPE